MLFFYNRPYLQRFWDAVAGKGAPIIDLALFMEQLLVAAPQEYMV